MDAFARSIEDIVDAVRIDGAPPDLLQAVISGLRAPGPVPPRAGGATPPPAKVPPAGPPAPQPPPPAGAGRRGASGNSARRRGWTADSRLRGYEPRGEPQYRTVLTATNRIHTGREHPTRVVLPVTSGGPPNSTRAAAP
jgi:hypothetical protein